MGREDPQLHLRVPAEVKAWIERQAQKNGSSKASEVVRAVRERMERDERRAQA